METKTTTGHSVFCRCGHDRTLLDRMLGAVACGIRELTIDTDDYTEEQRDRIIQTAKEHGLSVSRDRRFILIRALEVK